MDPVNVGVKEDVAVHIDDGEGEAAWQRRLDVRQDRPIDGERPAGDGPRRARRARHDDGVGAVEARADRFHGDARPAPSEAHQISGLRIHEVTAIHEAPVRERPQLTAAVPVGTLPPATGEPALGVELAHDERIADTRRVQLDPPRPVPLLTTRQRASAERRERSLLNPLLRLGQHSVRKPKVIAKLPIDLGRQGARFAVEPVHHLAIGQLLEQQEGEEAQPEEGARAAINPP